MLKLSEGPRGLGCFEATDLYGTPYSLQESSLATQEAVWVGSHRAVCPEFGNPEPGRGPRLCREGRCAFAAFHIPGADGEIEISARMHLSREMAADLANKLTEWYVDGDEFWNRVKTEVPA